MWLVETYMEDMPIVKKQWLYQDKFYADRHANGLIEQGEDVQVTELKVEDLTYCKPATEEMKRLVWGEQYL